jgi:GT2 family glycosyltransferase
MSARSRLQQRPAVRSCAWLAADILLAVVDFDTGDGADLSVSATVEGSPVPTQARSDWFRESDHEEARQGVFAVRIGPPRPGSAPVELCFGSGSSSASLGPAPARTVGVDLRTLVREHFAGLDVETRAWIMSFLLESSGTLDSSVDAHQLSESLALVRDALRDPHPRINPGSGPTALRIDNLIRVDERSFFVRGWAHDEHAPIVRLSAVSPEGSRVEMLEHMVRVRRRDLDELFPLDGPEHLGFVCTLQLDAPSRLSSGWIFELENAAGYVVEVEAPDPIEDLHAARDAIVSTLGSARSPLSPVTEHVFPAVSRLQERLAAMVEIEHVERYGEVPRSPDISIIVPLYKRIDLLQHQLAQFAHDPELSEAELIYVLDSPELSTPALIEAERLFKLYQVPFQIVTLSRNGGFAVANNRGVSIASGRLLLLLNSDVLPASPGWLSRLAGLHDTTPRVGALGPKLLFEDESLQHAGMYFRRSSALGAWENAHYFKGLHGDLPAANVPRPVPALTAACMMIGRALYEEVDGLCSTYIQGDYEDSDLCLRLGEAGYENWYRPEVALYHLEGRSYATADRQANARYNTWLQTSLWSRRIERLMSEHDATEAAVSWQNA